MPGYPKKCDDDVPPGHPFAETRNLYPRDILLRKHGYRIASRPRQGAATWSLAGVEYTEAQALSQVRQEG